MSHTDVDQTADRDERLGEAVEEYLTLHETGFIPDPDEFASRYPDLGDDLREALEGLSLVQGLVGSSPGRMGRKLESGCRLAGYRIVGELGAGGMGVVYEAVHLDLDRPVALKVLDSRATHSGTGARRFLNEAKTAAALHHTNIVPVFDVGHVGGLCYYAMQRIEGSGLDRVIKALRRDRTVGAGSPSGRTTWFSALSKPASTALDDTSTWYGPGSSSTALSPSREPAPPAFVPPTGSAYYRWVASVGRQAAQALAYAHARNVVHRDIKPSNLLIDSRGMIWVTDFGLARRMSDPNLSHSESLVGTPRYMSPEQARSQPLDGRSDLFSLGATLYELLTLRPPFDGASTAALLEQIARDEPIAPHRLDPRSPRDLETIILKTLAKRPGDRYADAEELDADLERYLNLEPVKARRIGPIGRTVRLVRRHPALSVVTTTAVAVILAVATIAYLRVVQERDRAITAEKKTQAALREGYLSQASLVRISPVPNRRERGLALLHEAAELDPDADLRSRLRVEAIGFSSLRDVERGPTITIEKRAPGLVFWPSDGRLAAVTEDRAEWSSWSIAEGTAVGTPQATGRARSASAEREGENRPPFGFFFGRGLTGPRIAACGPILATIWPDHHGLRIFDSKTGNKYTDISYTDGDIVSVFAMTTAAGPRLITIDRPRMPQAATQPSNPAARSQREGPPRGMREVIHTVSLWDPARPSAPLAVLADSRDRREAQPNEPPQFAPMPMPVVAVPTTGEIIATGWQGRDQIVLHAASDGAVLNEVDVGTAVTALALDRFGHLAAAGGGTIHIWGVGPSEITPLPGLTPHRNFVWTLQYSPGGSLLAIAGGGKDVELWDPAANVLVAALPTTSAVLELEFSPSGRELAGGLLAPGGRPGTVGGPGGVALWSIVDSPVLKQAHGLEEVPASLVFDRDGRLAATFRGNESARLWSPTFQPAMSMALPVNHPSAVSFDIRNHLVTFDGDTVSWYDTNAPKAPLASLDLPALEPFDDGGTRRGTGQGGMRGRSPDGPSPKTANSPPEPPPPASENQSPRRSNPGRGAGPRGPHTLVSTFGGQALALIRSGQIFLWRAAKPHELSPVTPPPEPYEPAGSGREPRRPNYWFQAALSPSADRLYLVSWGDSHVHVWSLAGDQATRVPWPNDLDPPEPRSAPPKKAEFIPNPAVDRPPSIGLLALSPDGATLALVLRHAPEANPTSNARGDEIVCVDTATGTVQKRITDFDPADGSITAMRFNSTGDVLALGTSQGAVLLVHLSKETERPLRLTAQRGVTALAFDYLGRRLAVASEDRTVAVWDLARLGHELENLGLAW